MNNKHIHTWRKESLNNHIPSPIPVEIEVCESCGMIMSGVLPDFVTEKIKQVQIKENEKSKSI